MSVLDVSLKDIFGRKVSIYIMIAVAACLIGWNIDKYFVTVPLFAQSMQSMQKQMWTGDRLQEKNWLESEINSLKNKLLGIWAKGADHLTSADHEAIRNINEQIAYKQKRIDQINYEMEKKWGE